MTNFDRPVVTYETLHSDPVTPTRLRELHT
jgi:hypothetical protein